MRVIMLTQDFPPRVGGTAEFLHHLARMLVRRGDEVTVVTPSCGDSLDRAGGYRLLRYHRPRRLASLAAAAAFSRAIPGNQPTVVFLGHLMTTPGLAPLLWRRLAGLPYVILIHGTDLDYSLTASRIDGFVARRLLENASSIIVNSRYTGSRLSSWGFTGTSLRVVHPGVDADHFRPGVDSSRVRRAHGLDRCRTIITVARLVQRKGHAAVMEALPRVMERVGPVVYVVVGSGPEENRLRARARKLGVENCVRFVGHVERTELPAYYCAADLFVMPARELGPEESSDVEGFGIAFSEAASCGLPVIGSHSGGIPEAVADGVTGLLVEPGDDAGLAEAMTSLLLDRSLAGEMGRRGRVRVEKELTWEEAGRAVGDHLESIAECRGYTKKGW
jgi:phosphatidylinositol alpha-1,6-mannosyltransferase